MRRIALTLIALALVATTTPAAANLEACIPALEAKEAYLEAIEIADTAYSEASRPAEAAYSAAMSRAGDIANRIRSDASAASDAVRATAEALERQNRDDKSYSELQDIMERARIIRNNATLMFAAEMNRANETVRRARDSARAVREEALAEPQASYDTAKAEAKTALRESLLSAYPGPMSDNDKIMDRLLAKFLRECQALLE